MSTPRFLDVLNQIVLQTVAALNAAQAPSASQVGIGNPVSTELVKILGAQQYQVTIYERKGTRRSMMRYPVGPLFEINAPPTTLMANVPLPAPGADWTIELGGSISETTTIGIIVGYPPVGTTVQIPANTTLAACATLISEAINALGAGAVATVDGTDVQVAGTPICLINVAATARALAQEINRIQCSIELTIWSPNPELRFQIRDIIESGVGTYLAPFVTLSDGTPANCVLVNGSGSGMNDDSQSSYSLFSDVMIFHIEYGVLKIYASYPIAIVETSLATNDELSITSVTGG